MHSYLPSRDANNTVYGMTVDTLPRANYTGSVDVGNEAAPKACYCSTGT